MATLHIDEYTAKYPAFSRTRGRAPDTIYPKIIKTQPKITTTETSQQSAVVDPKTAFISIRPVGGAVYIEIGSNPTATANSKYLEDGDVYDRTVSLGDRVAVIDA